MIELTVCVEKGHVTAELEGENVTGENIINLYYGAGQSLGSCLQELPAKMAEDACQALMDGMEAAKKETKAQ